MKLLKAVVAITLVSAPVVADEALDAGKISEAFGHVMGQGLDIPGFSFDVEGIIRGLRMATEGKPSPMSDAELEDALTRIQERAMEVMALENLEQANVFLKTNAKEKGVIAVEDKLQYKVTKVGHGPKVVDHATCRVRYTGRYADGAIFGTSDDQTVELNLTQSIPGFSKGIVGMQEGEKRLLYVHPDLGYGTTGQLQPNALLIFDVEVVDAGGDPLAFIGD